MTKYDLLNVVLGIYQRVFEKRYSVDRLLLNPQEALSLCDLVRAEIKENIQDEDILTPLLNWRKRGKK